MTAWIAGGYSFGNRIVRAFGLPGQVAVSGISSGEFLRGDEDRDDDFGQLLTALGGEES
jgi:hypothetical protein